VKPRVWIDSVPHGERRPRSFIASDLCHSLRHRPRSSAIGDDRHLAVRNRLSAMRFLSAGAIGGLTLGLGP
jgi:hypothetical protein